MLSVGSLTSARTTAQPRRDRSLLNARPIPEDEPVTMAVGGDISSSSSLLIRLRLGFLKLKIIFEGWFEGKGEAPKPYV